MIIKQYCSGTIEHTYHTCQGHISTVSLQSMPNIGRVKPGVQRQKLQHGDDNDREERSQSERETEEQDARGSHMPERTGLQTETSDG